MPTTFKFSRYVEAFDIPVPAMSVGAHLAAKLQLFGSDERTLTDELCDMLCMWLGRSTPEEEAERKSSLTGFFLSLSKTTASEEAKIGADLELIIQSPMGIKRCLIQAKVLDPITGKLRCDNVHGWTKLRAQLVAARHQVGPLAFLLIYVPGALLDGQNYGFGTYEQAFHPPTAGNAAAYFGATLIAVDHLLRQTNRWQDSKAKVPQASPGQFKDGVAFWQVLLELFSCRRSNWSGAQDALRAPGTTPYLTLRIGAETDRERWARVQELGARILDGDHGQRT